MFLGFIVLFGACTQHELIKTGYRWLKWLLLGRWEAGPLLGLHKKP